MTSTPLPEQGGFSERLDEILKKLNTDARNERESCISRNNWEGYNFRYDEFEAEAKAAILTLIDEEIIGNKSHRYQRAYRAGTGSPTNAAIIAKVVAEKAVNKRIEEQRKKLGGSDV